MCQFNAYTVSWNAMQCNAMQCNAPNSNTVVCALDVLLKLKKSLGQAYLT